MQRGNNIIIIKIFIHIMIAFIVAFSYNYFANSLNKSSSSVIRDSKPTEAIILDESTPLTGILEEGSLIIELFDLINEYRISKGLSPLAWSDDLASCGDIRAEECSIVWSHTRPDGSSWYTVNPSIMYGENLAKNFSSATDLLNAWIKSPAHNDVLLTPDFKYIGIGKYDNRYFAAEFCY